jgi:DNA-binding response OmpR family regulator
MESDRTPTVGERKETVLVIDDDDLVADICRQILQRSGYDVVVARSGKEAIDVFKGNQTGIDMVILDMILPDMSGRDIYDRLKIVNPDLNVLFVSGYAMDAQMEDIMEGGGDGFIQKPFNMDTLLEKTREILASQ